MTNASDIVGRLAPSPTGAQHLGNARTYLLVWLHARSQGGRLVLRIEDIDSPRVKPGADREALDDLRWLGLDWDFGPDADASRGPYWQTARLPQYQQALDELCRTERVYPCTCSRKDVAMAASAPHAGQDSVVYPGTCSSRSARDRPASGPYAWRFRTGAGRRWFVDEFRGRVECDLGESIGDFVVARAGGEPAYQLAVVVDDHAMGITNVVRGDDLVLSTFRQLELYSALGWDAPRMCHVPLVVGPDGRRLAKRHGDTRLSTLRRSGVRPERVLGLLGWSCGWLDEPRPVELRELLAKYDLTKVPRQPWVVTATDYRWLLAT